MGQLFVALNTGVPQRGVSEAEALAIMESQIATIADNWDAVCGEAALTDVDKKLFAGRQFLNPFCVEGLDQKHKAVIETFDDARGQITG